MKSEKERRLLALGVRSKLGRDRLWQYDYDNQADIVDGVYQDCGHPEKGTIMGPGSPAPGELFPGCSCYGKAHAGEKAPNIQTRGWTHYSSYARPSFMDHRESRRPCS